MLEPLWQRLDSGARLALPFVTTLLCTLLSVVAWPIPWLGAITPPLGLVALYYWSIHRPGQLRPGMVFVIGFLNDVINFLPLGLSALLFVAARQMVLRQRRFFSGHSFFMMWFGFALMIVIVTAIEWTALSIIRWQIIPVWPVLMQGILAIVVFPLPCWLLIHLQRVALPQE